MTGASNDGHLTIALIGGPMTVDDGTTLDSRQPIEGDAPSDATRKALATSALWWNTAVSLVAPVLASAGQDSFALVIGPKSIADLRVDGSLRRSTLRKFLPGGTGRISVIRTSMDDDRLPGGYELGHKLEAWNGQSLGRIGIRREGADRQWQLLDGNEYYLTHIGDTVGATVVVDTTGAYMTGEEYGPPSSDAFEGFEKSRRHTSTGMLVLPHTHATSMFVGRYVDWLEDGRRPTKPIGRGPGWDPDNLPRWDPSAPPDPIKYTHPVPVDAQFRVTGLVQQGRWVDAADLESARSLLQSRYDLRLGIWDLVANPTLRETLLERRPVELVPEAHAVVPVAAKERASAAVARKVERDAHAAAALQHVAKELKVLKATGWSELERTWARYPLSEPFAKWPGQEPSPLVSLILEVGRGATKVLVRISLYNDLDLSAYLNARRDELEQIAGKSIEPFERHDSVLLTLRGGWGDDVDWSARASEVIRRTSAWATVFDELVDSSLRVLEATHPQAQRALALRIRNRQERD